jgi:glycosyltransferase involved in cell wall biosynthesis
MPSIAIGVQVQTEPAQLRATIDSLHANTILPFSLVLLPDGPDESTRQFLSRLDVPQFGTDQPRGGAACLNRLANNTDTDIIVLLESGSLVGPGWLDHLLNALDSRSDYGLAGPSTNRSWNEQGVFSGAGSKPDDVARTAALAVSRFGSTCKLLAPLYSLADFCYAVRREVLKIVGEADGAYGMGPCWEMDYNVRAARAGFQGVWACASYVLRAPVTDRRRLEEAALFEASKRRYQDKFCGLRLRGAKADYRPHCRGDACRNFAPKALIMLRSMQAGPVISASPASGPPLVSCIIPTCNRRQFIPRAIQCFQRQDYPNLELVIIDNGSDPIGDLLPDDPRVRYTFVPKKLTIGSLRNLACRSAQGEIVVHWDDDDWYPAHRVRIQVQPLIENRADITGTSSLYYYEAATGQAFLYRYSGVRAWVSGNTLAYKRSLWQRQPFPDAQVGEDSHFIWRAARTSVLDLKDPALCVGSVHPANASPKNTKGAFWIPQSSVQVFSITDETFAGKALASERTITTPPANVPLVSCVMPTFNRRPFIPLALACFQSQTYPSKELVVVDDGLDPVGDLLSGLRDVHYVRVPRRMTIGAKRNLGCREGRGEIIAQWDDDDWYAPNRLMQQVAPIMAGTADMTGLANRFMLEVPSGRFWTLADELHRRMFVGDLHGGTLVYRKSLLAEGIKYPEINLAEDASLIQQATRRRKRVVRLENAEQFVYLRHSRNAWKFEVGQFLNPQGWSPTTAPSGFSNAVLDLYRTAAESLALAR